jgi:hypothetical protein
MRVEDPVTEAAHGEVAVVDGEGPTVRPAEALEVGEADHRAVGFQAVDPHGQDGETSRKR